MENTQIQKYTNGLCSVLSEKPKVPEKIFKTIFELLKIDSNTNTLDGNLWNDICHRFCDKIAERPIDLMTRYFYKSSRVLMRRDEYYVDNAIPSILLLKLLLYIINQVRDGSFSNEWLDKFSSTAYTSDGNGILSVGMGTDIEYLKFVTTENIEEIEEALKDIKNEFAILGITYEGNYTLGQVVGIYCQELLKYRQKDDKSKSLKRSRDTDSGGNTNDYDWRGYIRLATPEEILKYSIHKKRQEESPADIAKRKADTKAILDHLKEQLTRINAANIGSKPSKNPKLNPNLTPECRYGSACHQKNPYHLRKYYHPPPGTNQPDNPNWRPGGGSKSKRTTHAHSTKRRHPSIKRTRRRSSTKRRRHTRHRRR
jgi:hypothetical protein